MLIPVLRQINNMKKLITLILLISTAFAQTQNPTPTWFSNGFYPPSSNTPPTGLKAGGLHFNTSTGKLSVYNGSVWQYYLSEANAATGYVPANRTLTINGTAYDLSANRSWTIDAGVTSVFGRTGAVTAQSGDYTFSQLSGKPTTLAGYGITDAYPLSGNPSGFLTTVTSSQIATALGYTPVNYTVSNGLTLSGADIKFGGTLTQNTQILGTNYSFAVISSNGSTSLASFQVSNSTGASIRYSSDSNLKSIDINSTAFTIRDDTNNGGVKYAADYSASFTDRSLVDKAYVTSTVAAINTSSGSFTPEVSTWLNSTGITSSWIGGYYIKVGNVVIISGRINTTPSSSGALAIEISLPVPSDFTYSGNVTGFAVSDPYSRLSASALVSTDHIQFSGTISSSASYSFDIYCMYTVQ